MTELHPKIEQFLREHDEEAADWLFVVQTVDDVEALEALGFTAVLGGRRDRVKGMATSFDTVVLCHGVFDEGDQLRNNAHSLLRLDKSPALALGYPSTLGPQWNDDQVVSIRRTWLHLCRDAISEEELAEAVDPDKFAPFPLSAVPTACRQLVQECAAAQGVDPAFVGVPLLAVLAGSIGISRRVEVKHGWVEPPIIWTATVAPSGSGKSPPLRQLLKPLFARDQSLRSKAGSAAEDAEEPEDVPHLDVVVSDVTSEGLALACRDNPRGLLLYRDELSGWVQSFNKYRQGDDAQQWLELWSANPLKITRKTQAPIVVDSPAVSVVGTIQPDIARSVFGARDARSSGLTARLLFVQPPLWMPRWSSKTVSGETEQAYENVVNQLLDLTLNDDAVEQGVLRFCSDGVELFAQFYNEGVARQAQALERGDLDTFAMIAKVRGYAVRLALIMALAKAAEDGRAESLAVVDANAAEAGITLANWFEREAGRLTRSWGVPAAVRREKLDQKVLEILSNGDASRSELSDRLGRNYRSDEVGQSLQRLRDRGLVERKAVACEQPGRTPEVWGLVRKPHADSA